MIASISEFSTPMLQLLERGLLISRFLCVQISKIEDALAE